MYQSTNYTIKRKQHYKQKQCIEHDERQRKDTQSWIRHFKFHFCPNWPSGSFDAQRHRLLAYGLTTSLIFCDLINLVSAPTRASVRFSPRFVILSLPPVRIVGQRPDAGCSRSVTSVHLKHKHSIKIHENKAYNVYTEITKGRLMSLLRK